MREGRKEARQGVNEGRTRRNEGRKGSQARRQLTKQ